MSSLPTKIIFLDIDGPMIPTSSFLLDRMCSFNRIFPPHTIAVLTELCKRSEASVVFNTTHNNPMSGVADIDLAIVQAGFPRKYIHPTDFKTRYPSIRRSNAIAEWLENHPEVTDWVAIDDVLCAMEPNMILVDPDAGLHIGHLNQALQVLGGSPVVILV